MFKSILSMGVVVTLAGGLLIRCGQKDGNSSKTNQEVAAVNVEKLTLEVKGMTCSGCEGAVESALKKVDGVAKVKADYQNDRAEVEFDPQKASVDKLVAAVNGSGYTAKPPQTN